MELPANPISCGHVDTAAYRSSSEPGPSSPREGRSVCVPSVAKPREVVLGELQRTSIWGDRDGYCRYACCLSKCESAAARTDSLTQQPIGRWPF